MSLLTLSSALQAPSCSCTRPSDNASLYSVSKPSVSCSLRVPFSAISRSHSQGFAAYSVPCNLVSPLAVSSLTRGSAGHDAKKRRVLYKDRVLRTFHYAKSPGCGVIERRSFICAALGNARSGQAETGEPAEEKFAADEVENKDGILVSGSPVVIVEAPAMLKTAEPMPMMRPNRGLLKPGDAGRVIDRRPKDMWAVRFVVGAYLIDRKCFEPLDPR